SADRSLLAALVAATAWLSLPLVRGPGELAAIWVGNGILVGWLLSRRTATWPGYLLTAFLAEMPARILAGDAPLYALAIAGCNLVEVLLVAAPVRRVDTAYRHPRCSMRSVRIVHVATLSDSHVVRVLAPGHPN